MLGYTRMARAETCPQPNKPIQERKETKRSRPRQPSTTFPKPRKCHRAPPSDGEEPLPNCLTQVSSSFSGLRQQIVGYPHEWGATTGFELGTSLSIFRGGSCGGDA